MKDVYYHLSVIRKSGLFDEFWYQEKYLDVRITGIEPIEHYLRYGVLLERDPGPNFSTRYYLQSNPDVAAAGINPLLHFILHGCFEGREATASDLHLEIPIDPVAQALKDVVVSIGARVRSNELLAALNLCNQAIRRFGNERFLLASRAALTARIYGWVKSAAEWQRVWNLEKTGALLTRSNRKIQFQPHQLNREFLVVNAKTPTDSWIDGEIVVYTTLFGSFDELKPIEAIPGIDFLCFTDSSDSVKGWTTVLVEDRCDDANLSAKEYKVLPHRFLTKYRYSLYVDASFFFFGDLANFIGRWLYGRRFVMFRHAERNDAYDEAEAVLCNFRHEPKAVVDQMAHYEHKGLPHGAGLAEAGFIWREHGNPDISRLMETWWEQITRFTKRDQLSLCFLMWETGSRPELLPSSIGNIRMNTLFCNLPHKTRHAQGLQGSKLKGNHGAETATSSQIRATNSKPRIRFLFNEAYRNAGSTIMRGQQLSDIVRDRRGQKYEIEYSLSVEVKDAILVLNKGFLKTVSPVTMLELKSKNVALLADYIDDPIRTELDEYIDVYVASSLLGYFRISHALSSGRCAILTHHADPRIAPGNLASRGATVCYAGELVNAQYREELPDLVDFIRVNTKNATDEWISRLRQYNVHYAVRAPTQIVPRSYKPFLKGFTAARCGAQVIAAADDGDTLYYLGDDYPYLLRDTSLDAVRETIRKALKDYGSKDWKYGIEIMNSIERRSSDRWIADEFDSLIDLATDS